EGHAHAQVDRREPVHVARDRPAQQVHQGERDQHQVGCRHTEQQHGAQPPGAQQVAGDEAAEEQHPEQHLGGDDAGHQDRRASHAGHPGAGRVGVPSAESTLQRRGRTTKGVRPCGMMASMRIGFHTGYWAAGPPAGAAEAVAAADELGLDSVWTAESYGSDAFTPLAWWGAGTSRVRLGTGIAQLSARAPAATAMTALTLDHLSGGRFVLGLGASGPQVVEGWYGQPYPRPLERT